MTSLLLLWLLHASVCTQAEQIQKPLAFVHVTMIDGTGAPAKPDMTVVVVSDRITDLGQSQDLRIPKNAQVVDGRGKFLIPGLWDMHVHWYGYDKAYLRLFIINGVTGARIMWGAPIHFDWRREIQHGTLLGPRLVISSTILDGPKAVWPGSAAISNESEAPRRSMRRVFSAKRKT